MHSNTRIHPNKIRQVLFLVLLALLAIVIFNEVRFILPGILGAFTLYVLLRKPMMYLTKKVHWKNWAACLFLMLISLLVIILPFAWIVSILIDRIEPFLNNKGIIINRIVEINNYINANFGVDILKEQNLAKISNSITELAPRILGSTVNMITNLVVLYFILYFMLINISRLEAWIRKSVPLHSDNKMVILRETKDIILSNAIGIPLVALVQGALAVIGYYIFKIEEPIMWGIITGICSVVPFVGIMVAWVPIAIYTLAKGDTANGVGLILWCFILIGTSDNIIRLIFQKMLVDIHPIITVFGVIIGLNLLGFWGLVFGPLLLSLSLLLIRIYINEFVNPDLEVKPVTDEGKHET